MIRLLVVGKLKERALAELCATYLKRIRPWAPIEVVELKDAGPDKEAAALLAQLGGPGGNSHVVALDERGDNPSSREFSELVTSHGSLVFLIGGPDGLSDTARGRADRILSLSKLTFPHELARVLLLEQVYRGLSIARGGRYHRD